MAEAERKCKTFEEGQEFTDKDGNKQKATFHQMIELAREWLKEHTKIKNVSSVFDVKYNKDSKTNKNSPIRILNVYYSE